MTVPNVPATGQHQLAHPSARCRPPHDLVLARLPPNFKDNEQCDLWTQCEFAVHLLAMAKPSQWKFHATTFKQRSLHQFVVSGIDEAIASRGGTQKAAAPVHAGEQESEDIFASPLLKPKLATTKLFGGESDNGRNQEGDQDDPDAGEAHGFADEDMDMEISEGEDTDAPALREAPAAAAGRRHGAAHKPHEASTDFEMLSRILGDKLQG